METCWRVRKLSWGLGLFYLNRYLTLFGSVPVMLQVFWSTSNPNKIEVSSMLPKKRSRYEIDVQFRRCIYSHLAPQLTANSNYISLQLPWPTIISSIPSHFNPDRRCLWAFQSSILGIKFNYAVPSHIAMLIMRTVALYEGSRKVLAFYLIVAGVIIIVGWVSLHLNGESAPFHAAYSGRYWVEKKKRDWTFNCK